MHTKGVNTSGGPNRLRFENLSRQLSKVNIDVVHRVHEDSALNTALHATPSTGQLGCHFQDELENCKERETSNRFSKFYYEIWSYVQSLPELIHHQQKVIAILEKYISTVPSIELPSLLSLVSVLGRDLQEDLYPNFHSLFKVVSHRLDQVVHNGAHTKSVDENDNVVIDHIKSSPNIDIAGKIFECLSYLIKHSLSKLVTEPDDLRQYYGYLLGHNTSYVRDLASKCFSILFRKLKPKTFKSHVKKIVKAMCSHCINLLNPINKHDVEVVMDVRPIEVKIGEDILRLTPKKVRDIIDGVGLLVFCTSKGVKEHLHSQGTQRVASLFELMVPINTDFYNQLKSEIKSNSLNKTDAKNVSRLLECLNLDTLPYHVYCCGQILSIAMPKLFRHLRPSNNKELWEQLLLSTEHITDTWNDILFHISASNPVLLAAYDKCTQYVVEFAIFALSHSRGRALWDEKVKAAIGDRIISTYSQLCELKIHPKHTAMSSRLLERLDLLFCRLWIRFPKGPTMLTKASAFISIASSMSSPTVTAITLAQELLPTLPVKVTSKYLLNQLFNGVTILSEKDTSGVWLNALVAILPNLKDIRGSFVSCDDVAHYDDVLDAGEEGEEGDINSDEEEVMLSDSSDDVNDRNSHSSKFTPSVGENSELHLTACINYVPAFASKCLAFLLRVLQGKQLQNVDAGRVISCCIVIRWISTVFPDLVKTDEYMKQLASVVQEITVNYIQKRCDDYLLVGHLTSILTCPPALPSLEKIYCKLVKEKDSSPAYFIYTSILKSLLAKMKENPMSTSLLWSVTEVLDKIKNDVVPHTSSQQKNSLKFNRDGSWALSSIQTDQELNELVALIGSALLTHSHWIRITLLRILTYIPHPQLLSNDQTANEGVQYINVADLCLQASLIPINLANSRKYAVIIGNLEVLLRNNRLSDQFTRVVIAYNLSMLNVKFEPYWEALSKLLVTAVNNAELKKHDFEDITWPLLLQVLNDVTISRKDIDIIDLSAIDNEIDLDASVNAQTNVHDLLQQLITMDDGKSYASISLVKSNLFYYTFFNDVATVKTEYMVNSDARVDNNTVYARVFELLSKCPKITLKRSRHIVSAFLTFLQHQYYKSKSFQDDTELPYLYKIGFFKANEGESSIVGPLPNLDTKTLKTRLLLFLKAFAAINSPKQLFLHQLLYKYYRSMLSKPDTEVVKLSLDCMMTYKEPYLIPYKEKFKKLLDESTFRDELVVFNPNVDIDQKHRLDLLPVLLVILYGRCVSKSRKSKAARDKGIARRAAVLSYISQLNTNELRIFIHLMIRGILPQSVLIALSQTEGPKAEDNMDGWLVAVESCIFNIEYSSLTEITWERQTGFLYLLEHAIRLLGTTLSDYIPHLNKLVSLILLNAHATRIKALKNAHEHRIDADVEDDEPEDSNINMVEEGEDNEVDLAVNQVSLSAHDNYPGKVRTMCLLRLAESVHNFNAIAPPKNFYTEIFANLASLITTLPHSISSSKHPPAILKLINALVQYENTEHIISSNSLLIQSTIKCIAAHNNEVEVSKMIIDTVNILIDRNESRCIFSHAQLIIKSFCRRFLGDLYSSTDENSLIQMKLSELKIVPSGSVKGELKLLCRIAEAIFGREEVFIDNLSISNLSTMLLGMLRTYTTSKKVRIEEEWVINIIKIYQSLLWRMVDIKQHIPFVSRLFGPTVHSLSLLNLASVRLALVNLYMEMSKHNSTTNMLELSARSLHDLTSIDSTQLDSRDFDKVMPILQSLSSTTEAEGTVSWNLLLGPSFCKDDIRSSTLVTAILFELIRCMYDSELVIRTGALASLKNFINQSADWSGVTKADFGTVNLGWLEIIHSIIIPAIKVGIKQGTDSVKKGFMSLLAQIVIALGQSSVIQADSSLRKVYYSDLVPFLHEDPEQNVFDNLNHIQLHRRIRALHKIRSILKPNSIGEGLFDMISINEDANSACPFSINTLVNIFLPLAYHSLVSDEFLKKDHLPYIQECSSFIGGVAMHLPWSHYFNLIKNILRQLEKNKIDKEKILLTTLCHVLDSFHFDISKNKQEASEDSSQPLISPLAGDELDKVDDDVEEEIKLIEKNTQSDLLPQVPNATLSEDSIAYVVMNSIMPWVKVFLLKHVKDHKGNNNKVVRTAVAVALTKLVKRLQEPFVSAENKRSLFTSLVIAVVDTLKSRDTSTRDKARESLSKMAFTMGLSSLEPILYELKHALNDGYQRHIRNYTMRSLLSIVMEKYEAPSKFVEFPSLPILESTNNESDDDVTLDRIIASRPHFDRCIPMILESVVDDLVGGTKEDREVDGALRTVIREAKGSKSNDILEVTARSLLFRPTYAFKSLDDPTKVSSIHALTTPLLVALSNCDNTTNIGRISEGLSRVAMGIANNKSVSAQELLLYIHATLEPFVDLMLQENNNRKVALGKITRGGSNPTDSMELEADDNPYDELPSYMREESSDDELLTNKFKNDKKGKPSRHDNVTGYRANTWLPGERNRLTDQRKVLEEQKKEREIRDTVLDGASAPRLTGCNRHKNSKTSKSVGAADTDPCHVAAVKYALVLFNSVLKNSNILDDTDETTRSMILPFLPLLGQCLRLHGSANVVALAMRCLCSLLTWNLPIESTFSQAISNRILKLMFKGGVLLTSDNELVQACMKGLTSIYQMFNERKINTESSTPHQNMPLNEEKTRLLIQLLTVSMLEITSIYQNSAFALIRSILATQILLPELYDLIDKVIEQIVLSQKKSIRDSSASIVVYFLVHFPIGDNRFQHHIKQLLTNCAYEYEDGRVSAIETLQSLAKLLPQSVLDDNSQVIFMTLALRIVNDDSYKCREEAANVIVVISRRITTEKVVTLLDFSLKWLNGDFSDHKNLSIVRTGAQMTAILAQARAEVFKRPPPNSSNANENIVHMAVAIIYKFLSYNLMENKTSGALEMATFEEGQGTEEADSASPWTLCYYLLRLLEQMYLNLPAATDFACTHSHTYNKQRDNLLMDIIQEYMMYPHSWVRGVCVRILRLYFDRRGITKKKLSTYPDGEEICLRINGLYQLARKICIILNQPVLPADVLDNCKHCITFITQAMHNSPELSTKIEKVDENMLKMDQIDADNSENDSKREDEEEVALQGKLFGAHWVMRRLQGLGTDNRGKRRLYILTILNHVVNVATNDFVSTYARNMIEVPIRAQLAVNGPDELVFNECKEQSSLLLSSLENKVGSSVYMGLYSEISKILSNSKLLKKRLLAQEAITDPQAYAARKIYKSKSKKDGEKRKRKKSLMHSAIKGLDDHDSDKKKRKRE